MNIFKKSLASIGVASALLASAMTPSQAVVGGWESQTPETVKIWLSGVHDGQRICTGSHIGQGWVLTAKHCDDGLYQSSARIGWGDPRTGAWSRYDAASFEPLPTYGEEGTIDKVVMNPNAKTDLMLLHSPELENAQAPAFALRNGGLPRRLNRTDCTVYGYGLWSEDSKPQVAAHQKGLNVHIDSVDTYPTSASRAQLHTSSYEGTIATGDSGGPLICNGVLSGVTVSKTLSTQELNFMSISNNERQWISSVAGV